MADGVTIPPASEKYEGLLRGKLNENLLTKLRLRKAGGFGRFGAAVARNNITLYEDQEGAIPASQQVKISKVSLDRTPPKKLYIELEDTDAQDRHGYNFRYIAMFDAQHGLGDIRLITCTGSELKFDHEQRDPRRRRFLELEAGYGYGMGKEMPESIQRPYKALEKIVTAPATDNQ